MEDFMNIALQNPKSNSIPQMNSDIELLNNLVSVEYFSKNLHGIVPSLSTDGFSDHHFQPITAFNDAGISRSAASDVPVYDVMSHLFPESSHGCSSMSFIPEPGILVNSIPSVSGADFPNKQIYGGKKRKRMGDQRQTEKPREVVHVRAKRGQATDSHSLAERLRREKINEKLRSLQDLVPGCYKTMGMAVMLDVIINYVRSLQNQIDFLSMKLSAASLFYDFNSSEAEAMETIQGTVGYEEQGMDNTTAQNHGGISQFQTPWPLSS